MNTNIEKEYAVLLDEKQFEKLKNAFDYQIKYQTNYYYSSNNPHVGIRIRTVDNQHIFTLKEDISNETVEHEVILDKVSLDNPEVKKILEKFHVDNPQLMGKLENIRRIYNLDQGEIALDECHYLDKCDYEIEYELFDSELGDEQALVDLLKAFGIEYHENLISKYGRFINRKKQMKVAILIADGNEQCEALIVYDLLKRADIATDLISINQSKETISAQGLRFICDYTIDEVNMEDYICMVLPGGLDGMLNLKKDLRVNDWLDEFENQRKLIAAICASPSILINKHFVDNYQFACFPGFEEDKLPHNDPVFQIDNIISARSLGHAFDFAKMIITNIKDKKCADMVIDEIMQVNNNE